VFQETLSAPAEAAASCSFGQTAFSSHNVLNLAGRPAAKFGR